MVGVKRKLASTVTDEEPANKLRKTQKKTRQGSRMASKEQKLAMFKKPMPIIPLDQIPLEVLERLVNFLDVVTTKSFLFCHILIDPSFCFELLVYFVVLFNHLDLSGLILTP